MSTSVYRASTIASRRQPISTSRCCTGKTRATQDAKKDGVEPTLFGLCGGVAAFIIGRLLHGWSAYREFWRQVNRDYYTSGCALGTVVFAGLAVLSYRYWRDSRREGGWVSIVQLASTLALTACAVLYVALFVADLSRILS